MRGKTRLIQPQFLHKMTIGVFLKSFRNFEKTKEKIQKSVDSCTNFSWYLNNDFGKNFQSDLFNFKQEFLPSHPPLASKSLRLQILGLLLFFVPNGEVSEMLANLIVICASKQPYFGIWKSSKTKSS
jgi:hypothetical protein